MGNYNETNNKLTMTFDKDADVRDEVEEICFGLGDIDINPVGEAYVQMDGTCPSMWYSLYSGLVFIIDLVHDCERLKKGETVTIEGRVPTDEEMESIRDEDWWIED